MKLDDVPEEILLDIARKLQSYPFGIVDSSNLLSFCLVCRKFGRIGQEALFRSPDLRSHRIFRQLNLIDETWRDLGWPAHRPTLSGYHRDDRLTFKVDLLLTVLLQRPDLAGHVQGLQLDFNTPHPDRDPKGRDLACHVCRHWVPYRSSIACSECDVVKNLCIDSLSTNDLFQDEPCFNSKWHHRIKLGEQLALMGALLCAVPNLRHLNLLGFRDTHIRFYMRSASGLPEIQMSDWFGLETISPKMVPGLCNLKFLDIFGPPAPCLFEIPTLASLRMILPQTLDEILFDIGYEEGLEEELYDSEASEPPGDSPLRHVEVPAPTLKSNIRTLTVKFEAPALLTHRRGAHTSATYTIDLVNNLSRLEDLHLQLSDENGEIHRDGEGELDFDVIAEGIVTPNLRSLVLDVSGIYCWPPENAKPMLSLTHLSNLHAIVAPQEALVSFAQSTVTPMLIYDCEFPPSVDSIEVIDPGPEFAVWRKELFKCIDDGYLPNLKTFKTWIDHKRATADVDLDSGIDAHLDGIYPGSFGTAPFAQMMLGLEYDADYVKDMCNAGVDWPNTRPQVRPGWREEPIGNDLTYKTRYFDMFGGIL